ncbi:aspartate aminotransferase family protein [Kordiimonas lacus]|uniref:Putrescine aminotransferase n=1 Tax=Kordiimonas lacus TaxID=637679 RepID=A0A1G7FE91_9PROT|nr:aspartate aminotransferase family protein [Kordiimonas lacus]SDE74147.1 putrescine aminotransferase [Kordiimonas lacus]
MAAVERGTDEWQKLDVAHHLHPFTDPKYFDTKGPLVVTHADGVYITDSSGRKILDGMAGLWCVNVGYGRQELIDAAHAQMQKLAYYNVFFQSATPPQIELSRVLSEITPGDLNHFFFTNSGSEANDTIIRMVRHFWEVEGQPDKQIFIGRNLGYHGSTLAATSLGGMAAMHGMGKSLLPGFEHIMHPHWYAEGGDLSEAEFGLKAAQALEDKILELGPENVAAFVGEPIQGAGGVIDPPATYWPEIQRICRKYDVLLVADEVICGFGRLGHWFGCEAYGIQPDLMPMAKGLSSGYLPIAAVAYSGRVHKTLQEGGLFSHGYTYSGHPVSCAVALANIQLIKDENLIQTVHDDTAPYFRKTLTDAVADHPLVGEVRGAGLLAGIQLVKDKATKTLFEEDLAVAVKCRDHCLNNGLIMRAVGQSMVASPPLTITRAQIDELVEKAVKSLDQTAADVGVM